jgi:hypothetical protein
MFTAFLALSGITLAIIGIRAVTQSRPHARPVPVRIRRRR